jgi:hypothetical protein
MRWWAWSFTWITFIPIVTVPLTLAISSSLLGDWRRNCEYHPPRHEATYPHRFFSEGYHTCSSRQIAVSLSPGLLNLLPLLVFFSPGGRDRRSALAAGSFGALRLLIPTAALMSGVFRLSFRTTGPLAFHLSLFS